MNNNSVRLALDSCKTELDHIKAAIDSLGITSTVVPYLSKYAIIRACGCIESAFKTIIADYCDHRSKKQIKRFLSKRVREGSANPSFENMIRFLSDFDDSWRINFKTAIDAKPTKVTLKTSLQSLVDARNEFAHGGHPSATINDVISYFSDSREIIETMDQIIG